MTTYFPYPIYLVDLGYNEMSEQSYIIKHVVVILIESNYIIQATNRHSTRSLSSSRKLIAIYASFCEEHLGIVYRRNYAIQDVLS